MMLLLIAISFTVFYSIIEATHDVNIIRGSKEYSEYTRKWHAYGWIQNGLMFIIPCICLGVYSDFYIASLLFVITSVLFWQLHDSLIGWALYGDFFYLGNRGMDGWMNKVFWGGIDLSVIRLGVITCAIIEYFRNI